MRRRELYLLLFGAPALLAGFLLGAMVVVFALGIFWIFIFGDDTWPGYTNALLVILFAGTCIATFATLLYHAYTEGRRQEEKPLNRRHVAYAVVATLVLLIVPGLYAWHSSQRGDSTPESACAGYCAARGFQGSGMPPRNSGDNTCTCYGPKGEPAASFPLPQQ